MPKKKKSEGLQQTEKKSRAKYKCLPELADILEMVNLVPPDADMPNAGKVIEAFTNEWLLQEQKTDVDLWSDIFDECFKDFDREAKTNIFNFWFDKSAKSNNDLDRRRYKALLDAVIITYEEIYQTRKNIKLVIDSVSEKKKKTENSSWHKPNLEISIPITEKDGEFRASLPVFLELISTINLDRLRACEICNRVFWAKREESKTCSAPCFGILRTRRYRNLTPEEKAERKAKREANRELIKKGTAKSTKRSKNNEFI